MTSLVFSICLSAILSVASLFVILFRVSPLSSPGYSLPAFFLSVFLSVSSVGTLGALFLWKKIPAHVPDEAMTLRIALREGLFLGLVTTLLIVFHLLGVLTWWIALLLFFVFLLIEIALHM